MSMRTTEGISTVSMEIYREHVPLVEFVLGTAGSADESLTLVPMPKLSAGGAKAKRDLSVDQQELVDIMDRLEMRNHDFAVHLGIGIPRLSSYIYGQTASVPEDVMTRAREVLEEQSQSLAGVKQQFSRKMSAIIGEWQQRLKTETNEQLARYLGVTTMTIHRWRTDATQPDMTALLRYEQQVDRLESRMKMADEEMDRQLSARK